jgi:single-stranded-DNA-specific exonuclease
LELLRLCEIGPGDIHPDDVGWRLGPRLNAPGRIADAADALACLLADDAATAVAAARKCDLLNTQRKTMQQKTIAEAMADARRQFENSFIIVAGDGWHPGVIGIVASRLSEESGRPCAVIAWEGDIGRGSARSVPGVDLVAVFGSSASQLVRYGGHAQALGFSVERAKFAALAAALNAATAPLFAAMSARHVVVDAIVQLDDVASVLYEDLRRLEPHGNENPRPLLGVAGVELLESKTVGEKHWAVTVRRDGIVRRGIAFGLAEKNTFRAGDRCDIAFHLDRDTFRGPHEVRMRVREIAPAGDGIADAAMAKQALGNGD